MASNPEVEHLGEFDDAKDLLTTFCPKMTEKEYEDQTSQETEKALNELCNYLQNNPEAYYSIIHKRKQEELEAAGIFSYLKVRLMQFVHGEHYPSCLLSTDESAMQLTQLKTDMLKAFVYSEDSKGRRWSKRIAAQNHARKCSTNKEEECLTNKENSPVLPVQQSTQVMKSESKVRNITPAQYQRTQKILRSASKQKISPVSHSKLKFPPVLAVLPHRMVASPEQVSRIPPPPPPAPPLPVHKEKVTEKLKSPHSAGSNPRKRCLDQIEQGETLSPGPLSPSSLHSSSSVTEPLLKVNEDLERVKEKELSGALSDSLTSSSSDAEFVTPDADIPVPKRHKRTLSNTSTSSQSSLTSIHSELISSNPLNRLRRTQIARSPGGTPLRLMNRHRSPQEPLHKALVTVLKEKFRNARTPSPLTVSSSTSLLSNHDFVASRNDSFNSTFSP